MAKVVSSSSVAIYSKDLYYRYEMNRAFVLSNLSFCIPVGQWVCIVGRSGSGKSTLCQMLNGYLPRSGGGERKGMLHVLGNDPLQQAIGHHVIPVGVVGQHTDAQFIGNIVEEEIAFGPENLQLCPSVIEQRVKNCLSAVDLIKYRFCIIRSLSDGQRRRVAIASILALSPAIVVLDDASSSLDDASRQLVMQCCHELHAAGITIMTVSGRFDEHALAAQRVIVMEQGRIYLDNTPEQLVDAHRTDLVELGLLHEFNRTSVHGYKSVLGDEESPLLQIKRLSFYYGDRKKVLDSISFTLQAGQWVFLSGDNGSGKTTLAKLLIGMLCRPKGTVLFQGKDCFSIPTHVISRKIGYVHQQPEEQFLKHTVWEECVYGVRCLLGTHTNQPIPMPWRTYAEYLLDYVGLWSKRDDSPYLLSFGEKKRLSIVSQFIVPKALYILDEPTVGSDYTGVYTILNLCRQQVNGGATVVVISHDCSVMTEEADVVLKLSHGQLMN